ncbi:hypothetical protein PAXRUDRAFT_142093, partial [Paxillus rubicundulus Ve08.2h10]
PPVLLTFWPQSLPSNSLSIEPTLTHVPLATEPVHSYMTTALRPSRSVPVHPNMLTDGLTLLEFLSLLNLFRVEPIAPFFIFHLFVPTS